MTVSSEDYVLHWLGPKLLSGRPKLLLLDGVMGSGKTTFATYLASQLGAPGAASPSFALHSRYEGHRGVMDHLDLDRLKSAEDLESIGFWDLISEVLRDERAARRFVVIEWASRLKEFGFSNVTDWAQGFEVSQLNFSGFPQWQITEEP